MAPTTLFDKIWAAHEVAPGLLYVDLHLVHEVTSPQAFDGLRLAGRHVRRPDRTVATVDHNVSTDGTAGRRAHRATSSRRARWRRSSATARSSASSCTRLGLRAPGIVHVIGPELGLTQPGMTIVCGDSHTATHGAFGALAFGIGTSEVEHVLATQCIVQRKPRTMAVRYEGALGFGVTAKDLILGPIGQIGIGGRHRPRRRVHRPGRRGALDGGPHDGLQHDDRGRRPGGHDRAGRDDLRVGGRARGRGRPGLDGPAHRRRCDLRPGGRRRRRRAEPDGELGDEPGPGRRRRRRRPRALRARARSAP